MLKNAKISFSLFLIYFFIEFSSKEPHFAEFLKENS